ncbi:hypothetical protein N7470_001568 [Penicillium chermesinum]|nr:hypothetical protein N7470_001568 [Penicillium chermesinum]
MRTLPASLADFALEKVLGDASQIFGPYIKNATRKTEWMKHYNDDTLLVHMNIPGTHDSATWNYTQATQDALLGVTSLNGVTVPAPETFRCQQRSLIDGLNNGIRVFDLRYAFDPTNSTLVFYHSQALLSQIADLQSVLFGFYQWLDDHPSEAVFLSLQYEGSTAKYAANDAELQMRLSDTLTNSAARRYRYFVQRKGQLGTLGEARGKLTLFRRFDLDQLPASYTEALPGLHFSPSSWTDNSPDITLTYDTAKNLTAHIEDYYQPLTPSDASATEAITWKYNATTKNLLLAASQYPDDLFWTWASSEDTENSPPIWPQIMAVGNGSSTPKVG